MKIEKLLIIVAVIAAIAAFFWFDLGQYLDLQFLKAQQQTIEAYYRQNPIVIIFAYASVYILVTGLSLPGATILTLGSGALFGLLWGTVIASIASTLGATLAFLIARFALHDWVQKKFGRQLQTLNEGIRRDGAFYLFTLRLIPAFPFFLINLAMALTPIKTFTFLWVSQIGMLAGTTVYVNAGTQLAQLENLRGILSFNLIASFALLAIFPWLTKALVTTLKKRRVYKPFRKPESFDTNLVVIGAGSAGLVSAYIAAAVKANVILIEKNKMGGDCLNTGCVPSKALIRSAKFLSHIERSREFGIRSTNADFEFTDIMQRVQDVIGKIEPHDSIERYTQLGVECVQGDAVIESPFTVRVNDRLINTRNIIIASGAQPLVPPIEGLDKINYLTSDNLWSLDKLPPRLLVLGGGPIGCELAQAFARLGSQVTQVEMLPRLLSREDPEVSERVQQRFINEGIDVLTRHKAKQFIREHGEENERNILLCENLDDSKDVRIEFDGVLIALGRRANSHGFGLESLGVEFNDNGTIKVNEYLQTRLPNIYACGDVAGPFQFTHTAAHQAWYCAVNALFGSLKKFKADYSVIPWATFTDPEVARVGLNETDAREQNIDYEVTRYDIDDLDRAIADSEAHGFVKVLTVPGSDKILGVTIVGEHSADLIAEYILAMKHGIGLNKILGTIHIYPTLSEANKYAAGNWKRAHAPTGLLKWVQRYHKWQLHG